MTRIKSITLFLLLAVGLVWAQDEVVDRIAKAIEKNSVSQLSSMFDHSIEVVTPYADGVYSQNQASQVLKAFFSKHPCDRFVLDHMGNSSAGAKFVIASYFSGKNEYRVSVFLKKDESSYLIQGLSFED